MHYQTLLYLNVIIVVTMTSSFSSACSPPIGGYVEPTAAEMVHYSGHVLVGTVQSLIKPDPYYKGAIQDETYGASVRVRCTYKGEMLGDTITIHGAGNVPGHCTEKPLVAGTEYILFLQGRQPSDTSYEQSYPAVPYAMSAINRFRVVCGLELQYPKENGITLPRQICAVPDTPDSCVRYVEGARKKTPRVHNAEVRIQDNNTTGRTTSDPRGSSPHDVVSLTLLAACYLGRKLM